MEGRDFAEPPLFAANPDKKLLSAPAVVDQPADSPSPGFQAQGCSVGLTPDPPSQGRSPGVFVFNPFAEGYIARGAAFMPVKHQALLAEDLANLPQFLCQPDDVVLVTKRPSPGFLAALESAGFPPPEFVELRNGRIDPACSLCQRPIGRLQPWAWGPDSIKLLEPLFARLPGGARLASRHFNDDIARLYSKAWSAGFLRHVLNRYRGGDGVPPAGREALSRPGTAAAEAWLCSEQEAGTVVDNLEDALGAIADIRSRGHHRVVVKEAHGLAGHNAIRLWEPVILPTQRQWLAHALNHGRQLVVEPWLERELDFSVQLEMRSRHLELCGYTGLVNDRKGQFLANWAEADHCRRLPAKAAALFLSPREVSKRLQHLYVDIFCALEAELQRVGFVGPISIDAFVYRTPQGDCRLKPVVEINPRHTMGRLTVELMKHARAGTSGVFRLVNRAQARAEGFADLSRYAGALGERLPLRLEGGVAPKIRSGALCLNDPVQAQVCLATFEIRPPGNSPGGHGRQEPPPSP